MGFLWRRGAREDGSGAGRGNGKVSRVTAVFFFRFLVEALVVFHCVCVVRAGEKIKS